MPLIAFETKPVPVLYRNLIPISRVVQLTPVTPRPLLPAAPMVPDVCEPWPLSSYGSHVLAMALKPWVPAEHRMVRPPMTTENACGADQAFGARSECV